MSAADASAARTPHPPEPAPDLARARRICVHLTPFAPGRERLGVNHPRRNRTFHARLPAPVIRAVLGELRRAPAAVDAHLEVNGDLVLTGAVPPEVAGFLSSAAGEPVPLALIPEGLALAEWAAVRAGLIAAGWKPPTQAEEVAP